MEVKRRSWETRAEVTALTQVVELGVVATQASSGWVLKVEQIDWKLDIRERGKSKLSPEHPEGWRPRSVCVGVGEWAGRSMWGAGRGDWRLVRSRSSIGLVDVQVEVPGVTGRGPGG